MCNTEAVQELGGDHEQSNFVDLRLPHPHPLLQCRLLPPSPSARPASKTDIAESGDCPGSSSAGQRLWVKGQTFFTMSGSLFCSFSVGKTRVPRLKDLIIQPNLCESTYGLGYSTKQVSCPPLFCHQLPGLTLVMTRASKTDLSQTSSKCLDIQTYKLLTFQGSNSSKPCPGEIYENN